MMNEYLVTIGTQTITGASIIRNTFAVCDETMKSAKEYAIKNLAPFGKVVSVTAHKVKDGENVPEIYRSWIYR